MHSKIDVTVAAVIERNGEFLCVEEHVGGRLVINQPAGHLEAGESIVDAAVRETREETGFEFRPEHLIGIHLWPCDEADRTFLRISMTGTASPPMGKVELDEGIVAARWMSRAQIVERRRDLRSPLVLQVIDDYLDGTRHSLECLHYLAPPMAQAKLA